MVRPIQDTWPLPDVQHIPSPPLHSRRAITLLTVSVAAWSGRSLVPFVPGVVFVLLYAMAGWSAVMLLVRVLFGRHRRSPHHPRLIGPGRWRCSTWGGTYQFEPRAIYAPTSLEELLAVVAECGRAGRRVKPAASLHSWSPCAVTDDVSIQLGALDRVLAVNAAAMTIRAECGMRLSALYGKLDEARLALPSLPNVDTIQLGGAIANATHGTCIEAGTMCSLVIELELVVFQDGHARVLTLRRHTPDPHERHLFDAALVSFGSVGIIYAATLQCVEPYHSYVHELAQPYEALRGRFASLARRHYSVRFVYLPSTDVVISKIQVPIHGPLVRARGRSYTSAADMVGLRLLAFASERNPRRWRRLRAAVGRALLGVPERRRHALVASYRREAVLTWYDAELESRFHAAFVKHPFVNLEYAIPFERFDEAVAALRDWARQYPRRSFDVIVMRPVGADDAGYLSAPKGQAVVYFDVPYVSEDERPGMYAAFEARCVELGGRCSWSRLFQAPASEFLKNYPEHHRFVDAKRELDPANIFSNEFSDQICQAAETAVVN